LDFSNQIDGLTFGFIISPLHFRSFFLDDTLPFPYQNETNFLLIYAIGSKFTRISAYPINSNEIWKYQITLEQCPPSTVELIGKLINSENIIHTTGVCEKSNKIMLEDYIFPSNTIFYQEILDQLKQIPHVIHVKFEAIFAKKELKE
jgi:hypothetical protein